MRRAGVIEAFDLPAGRVIGGKYVVESKLGGGWEGEVYKVEERRTGIRRAVKLFYPQRNPRDKPFRIYATKLDRLRRCSMVMQYHHSETMRFHNLPVTCLVGEYVEGEALCKFLAHQRGNRLQPFEALHLIHGLACGLEQIHAAGEYHGDLHDENVIVRRRGIQFDLKTIDFFHWGKPTAAHIREDVFDLVRLLYDVVGGSARYAGQPAEIKAVCRGLRRDLIRRSFPTVTRLRWHLESFDWGG